MISQLSISPVGEGISLSKYVKNVIEVIKKHDVKYKVNDMSTVIETDDLETLFSIIKEAHDSLIDSGVKRIITELKIDDRRDKKIGIGAKVESIS